MYRYPYKQALSSAFGASICNVAPSAIYNKSVPTPANCKGPLYDPRCRGWYNLSSATRSQVQFSPPYVDYTTHLLTITFSNAYYLNSTFGVYAIDLNMTNNFEVVASQYPDLDHFFILDTNYNVVYHSWYPSMIK